MSHKQVTSLFLVWFGNVSQVGSKHGLFACSKIQPLFGFVRYTYSTRLTRCLLASTTAECSAFHGNTLLPTKQCWCYCVIVDATVRGIAEKMVVYTVVMEQTEHYNIDKTMQ